MKTKVKKLGEARIEITVTLDAEDLKTAEKAAVEKLAKEVKVEGFRKGKVPAEVAKKFIPDNDLTAETIDRAVRTTVIEAFRQESKSPLMIPSVNVTKYVPRQSAEYTATADILPEVKLGDYKKLGVKKPEVKITEKDVKGMLENLSEAFAEKKVVKRKAENSDEVVIDFVGKKDGKEFAGGSSKDYKLVLGSKTFIPGFEDGIVGHEVGDKFEIKLTFPKDYGVKDLAGAKATFEVLLKQVSEVKKAAIDDELAKKCGPFKNLNELKADIKKNLAAQSEKRALDKYKDDLIEALVKKSKVAAPEILISDQINLLKGDIERNAAARGLDFEGFLEANGKTKEDWEKDAREAATRRVKGSLVLQTLAVKEKVSVPDEVVAKKLAELREVYKKSPEALKQLKDPNVKANIKNRLVLEKTLEKLVEMNQK